MAQRILTSLVLPPSCDDSISKSGDNFLDTSLRYLQILSPPSLSVHSNCICTKDVQSNLHTRTPTTKSSPPPKPPRTFRSRGQFSASDSNLLIEIPVCNPVFPTESSVLKQCKLLKQLCCKKLVASRRHVSKSLFKCFRGGGVKVRVGSDVTRRRMMRRPDGINSENETMETVNNLDASYSEVSCVAISFNSKARFVNDFVLTDSFIFTRF